MSALKDLLERTHSPGAFKAWKHPPKPQLKEDEFEEASDDFGKFLKKAIDALDELKLAAIRAEHLKGMVELGDGAPQGHGWALAPRHERRVLKIKAAQQAIEGLAQ